MQPVHYSPHGGPSTDGGVATIGDLRELSGALVDLAKPSIEGVRTGRSIGGIR